MVGAQEKPHMIDCYFSLVFWGGLPIDFTVSLSDCATFARASKYL